MPPSNTPDLVVIIGASLFALFMVWRGWRLGVMRLSFGLAGLALGYSIGSSSGAFLAAKIPLLPEYVSSVVTGILCALVCYVAARILGAILFKRTAQQESTILRWSYGLLGGCLGLAEAAVVLWLAAVGTHLSSSAHSFYPKEWLPQPLVVLETLKKSLHEGKLGAVLDLVDPVPLAYYSAVQNGFKVFQDPQALGRFLQSPAAKQLAEHPKVVALRNDPDFQRQLQTGNLLELMINSKFLSLLADDQLRSSFLTPEIAQALEDAANKER